MGAAGSGRKDRKTSCVNGHDLTAEGAVRVVKRGKYTERQCAECCRERSRAWWRSNRG